MKACRLIVCIALMMLGTSAAASNREMKHLLNRPDEYAEDAAEACDAIADMLRSVEGLDVTQADGIVSDQKTGKISIGCIIYAGSSIAHGQGVNFPHDVLRKRMESLRWGEDVTRAGDGPGSTTYSLSSNSTMCTISAMWSAAVNEKAHKASEMQYELEVRCMKQPDSKPL